MQKDWKVIETEMQIMPSGIFMRHIVEYTPKRNYPPGKAVQFVRSVRQDLPLWHVNIIGDHSSFKEFLTEDGAVDYFRDLQRRIDRTCFYNTRG